MNTIGDLAASTNFALQKLGFPTHSTDEYRFMVGNGVNKMLERALPEASRCESEISRLRTFFVPHYDAHNADLSAPYEGILPLMQTLAERGILLAVASNKYQAAAEKLVHHYFPVPFAALFGQRDGVPSKPDPAVVHDILAQTGVSADEVLYVGDSGVDMQTAANAGVRACGVTWGFRPRTELEQYAPAHIVDRPEEILSLIY